MSKSGNRLVVTVILATIWFGICTLTINHYLSTISSRTEQRTSVKSHDQLQSASGKSNEQLQSAFVKSNDQLQGVSEDPEIKKWKYNALQLKTWSPAPKVTWNQTHYGENGRAVNLNKTQKELAKKTYTINNFNLYISDMVPFNRTLKDHRYPECKSKEYPKFLPKTSVVIVFHNEAWSTLLRNVWSIINRSPMELLEEIILVDDASSQDHLKEPLDNYVSSLPVPVRVHHSEKRIGLIRARLAGAKLAKGTVLTFLDAHCECSEGWLEPLLSRIAEDRRVVISPLIDTVSSETFEYQAKSELKGGFTFKLQYKWLPLSEDEEKTFKKDRTKPVPTPTIAGGLFSIDREYFYDLGSYDDGMDIWGSENIEMSIRVWQCGGSLEMSFCSRVGHVFRKSPIDMPGDKNTIIYHNTKRLVDVWLDEWKHYMYALYPSVYKVSEGDLSSRNELRTRLQCKSFRWYLENIYPESPFLVSPVYLGSIVNVKTNQCLFVPSGIREGGSMDMTECTEATFQRFVFSPRGEIQTDKFCLDGYKANDTVRVGSCHGSGGNQKWIYNSTDKSIKHSTTKQCIEMYKKNSKSFLPVLRICDSNNTRQQWTLENEYDWKIYFD